MIGISTTMHASRPPQVATCPPISPTGEVSPCTPFYEELDRRRTLTRHG